jgi:hypothetical protein
MNDSIAACHIGARAYAACQLAHLAKVMGVTSRGLFLLALPPPQIIFVSFERYRSPLTINLDRSFDQLCTVEVGTAVALSATQLIFPAIEISILSLEDSMWLCPLPVLPARPPLKQLSALPSIVQAVLWQRDSTSLFDLLPRLAGLPADAPLSAEQAVLLQRLVGLRKAVQTGDARRTSESLISLLGQGRGLTPAGDDIAMGLLLMLNRWHHQRDWTQVNQAVIEAAFRDTTTISANLIECAASGQGDERLLIVADGIAIGSASIEECIDAVLGWGSSSGRDALMGMALGVM